MWISPLVNLDRKGGALQIMIQQFRRAVGVAIVQGNAKHKLGHLHYVRESVGMRLMQVLLIIAPITISGIHTTAGMLAGIIHTPNGYETYLQCLELVPL